MNKYGDLPVSLGQFDIDLVEMMYYQYLPIKMSDSTDVIIEDRLRSLFNMIITCITDYSNIFGLESYKSSYVYLTVKNLFVKPECSYNRPGYHSDGFMTDDVNYIWSDKFPTVFNRSEFDLVQDDTLSLIQMFHQAQPDLEFTFPNKTLLRLNQFNIHKVGPVTENTMRTFVKISFSKDKYDLKGNSHNHFIDYDWEMKERKTGRNIPQSIITAK